MPSIQIFSPFPIGGPHSTVDSIFVSHPAFPGLILGSLNICIRKKKSTLPRSINSALLSEWAVQCLIAHQARLVLVSGKLVQKNTLYRKCCLTVCAPTAPIKKVLGIQPRSTFLLDGAAIFFSSPVSIQLNSIWPLLLSLRHQFKTFGQKNKRCKSATTATTTTSTAAASTTAAALSVTSTAQCAFNTPLLLVLSGEGKLCPKWLRPR